jgi:hypothetical protein
VVAHAPPNAGGCEISTAAENLKSAHQTFRDKLAMAQADFAKKAFWRKCLTLTLAAVGVAAVITASVMTGGALPAAAALVMGGVFLTLAIGDCLCAYRNKRALEKGEAPPPMGGSFLGNVFHAGFTKLNSARLAHAKAALASATGTARAAVDRDRLARHELAAATRDLEQKKDELVIAERRLRELELRVVGSPPNPVGEDDRCILGQGDSAVFWPLSDHPKITAIQAQRRKAVQKLIHDQARDFKTAQAAYEAAHKNRCEKERAVATTLKQLEASLAEEARARAAVGSIEAEIQMKALVADGLTSIALAVISLSLGQFGPAMSAIPVRLANDILRGVRMGGSVIGRSNALYDLVAGFQAQEQQAMTVGGEIPESLTAAFPHLSSEERTKVADYVCRTADLSRLLALAEDDDPDARAQRLALLLKIESQIQGQVSLGAREAARTDNLLSSTGAALGTIQTIRGLIFNALAFSK